MVNDNGQRIGDLHNIGSKLARVDALLSDLTKAVEALKRSNDEFHDRLERRLREVERKQDMDLGIAQHKQRLKGILTLGVGMAAAASGWVAYLLGNGK